MSMLDATMVALVPDFKRRLAVALTRTAIAIMNETVNEVQTITVTGTPTGGSFTLASLPGSVTNVITGTLTNAAATCTGLSSTVGLFVGMAVTGTNVPAGCTVAAIVSATAITLSVNATGTGAQSLTFSGTPLASISFNASAADVQATLQVLAPIGLGNVLCSGGPLPGTPIAVTFTDALGSNPQKKMTIGVNSLTGGSTPTPTVARTTPGVSVALKSARLRLVSKVLANIDSYINIMSLGVADNPTIQTDYPSPNYTLNVSEATVDSDISFQVAAIWNAYT